MIKIERILYPTDFSDYCSHARPYAIDLAKTFEAKVTLMHVVPTELYPASFAFSVDLQDLYNGLEEPAQKRIEELLKTFQDAGVDAESLTEIGSPFVNIVDAASRLNVDLIIMATHGWGAIKHMLLGSTAERVVRKAPCPVLTIRHPEHEFVHP